MGKIQGPCLGQQLVVKLICCLLATGSIPIASGGAQDETLTVLNTPCVRDTGLAVWTAAVRSLLECLLSSQQLRHSLQSIGLLQLDRRTSLCSLYRYRDVCHHLAGSLRQQQEEQQQECDTIVDSGSDYNVLPANAHFAAVWVGGKGPALENLVCGGESGPRNPVWSSGVAWTLDGAQLDGVNSRLWVNDSAGFNFSSGYTLAMEVKRQPGIQPLMEFTDCGSFTLHLGHWWEFLGVGRLFLSPMGASRHAIFTRTAVLTNDASEFAKIVVTHDRVGNRTQFYLNAAEVTPLDSGPDPNTAVAEPVCLTIGYREGHFNNLIGTIRMAAVANGRLPEAVILQFLSGN